MTARHAKAGPSRPNTKARSGSLPSRAEFEPLAAGPGHPHSTGTEPAVHTVPGQQPIPLAARPATDSAAHNRLSHMGHHGSDQPATRGTLRGAAGCPHDSSSCTVNTRTVCSSASSTARRRPSALKTGRTLRLSGRSRNSKGSSPLRMCRNCGLPA